MTYDNNLDPTPQTDQVDISTRHSVRPSATERRSMAQLAAFVRRSALLRGGFTPAAATPVTQIDTMETHPIPSKLEATQPQTRAAQMGHGDSAWVRHNGALRKELNKRGFGTRIRPEEREGRGGWRVWALDRV